MPACVEDFLSFVEGTARLVIHYIKFFFYTNPAFSRDRVVVTGTFYKAPLDIKIYAFILQFPSVCAQSGFLFV